MSFITAFMLMYMTEEEAFMILISFMRNYGGRRFYLTGMPQVYEYFYVSNRLLKSYNPKLW